MRKAAVIGGGAAGMMTAVLAAGEKTEIHLYEKNEKLGKKLFITGKGRCNVTNDCPTEEFFTNVVTNPKFLYSSAYSFDSAQVQEFFEAAGVRLKVERGNRVFPESDHSSDIIRALETELKRKNVQVHKNTKVKELLFEGDRVKGIRLENGKELFYDDVVVATGGMSYQTTGSDGDGYRFAEEAGLAVTPLRPALVPLTFDGAGWAPYAQLAGLALPQLQAMLRMVHTLGAAIQRRQRLTRQQVGLAAAVQAVDAVHFAQQILLEQPLDRRQRPAVMRLHRQQQAQLDQRRHRPAPTARDAGGAYSGEADSQGTFALALFPTEC